MSENCKECRAKWFDSDVDFFAINDLEYLCPSCVAMMLPGLQSRLDAKSAALVKFGRHLPVCAVRKWAKEYLTTSMSHKVPMPECTCGFDAAKGDSPHTESTVIIEKTDLDNLLAWVSNYYELLIKDIKQSRPENTRGKTHCAMQVIALIERLKEK